MPMREFRRYETGWYLYKVSYLVLRERNVRGKNVRQIPRPELLILLIVGAPPDRLCRWPNLNSHVSSLCKKNALLSDIGIGPPKQFYYRTLLSVVERSVTRKSDNIGLPSEIQRVKSQFLSGRGSNHNIKAISESIRNMENITVLVSTIKTIYQRFPSTGGGIDYHRGSSPSSVILDVSIATQISVVLKGRLVVCCTLWWCLPPPGL